MFMLPYHTMKKKRVEVKSVGELGEFVRKVRKSQRVTQLQLSQCSNLGSRFIVDFEAGKPTLHIGKALTALETLGVRLYAEAYVEDADA